MLWRSWKGRISSFIFSSAIKTLHVYTGREDPKVSSARTLGETASIAVELVASSSAKTLSAVEDTFLKHSRVMQEVEQTPRPLLTQHHYEQKGSQRVLTAVRRTPASQAAPGSQAGC